MELKKTIFLVLAFLFSSCSYYNDKMASFYLKKAEKTASKTEASREEIQSVYENLSKAIDHKANLPRSVEISEKITEASVKSGYADAYSLHVDFLKRYLRKNSYDWAAQLNLLSGYSLRGDLGNLDSIVSEYENLGAAEPDPVRKISFLLLTETAYCNLIPWVESQGYLSVNIDADHALAYLAEYESYLGKASVLRNEIEKPENKTIKASADKQLLSAYEISSSEVFGRPEEIKRNSSIAEKAEKEPGFAKALKYTLEGNAYLAKKNYSNARVLFKSALANYPEFSNAKKQAIETDFQEAMSLALMKNDNTELKDSLYTAYDDIKDLVSDSGNNSSLLPFIGNDKYFSEIYSLKAAVISALLSLEKFSPRKKKLIEAEFSAALDRAIQLNPQNKMAKEMFERSRNENKK